VVEQELSFRVKTLLDTLPPKEKEIILLRFGLKDGQTKTYDQIGELCGISRESVRKIKNKALRLLRKQSVELSYKAV